jgi:hypothetical protein
MAANESIGPEERVIRCRPPGTGIRPRRQRPGCGDPRALTAKAAFGGFEAKVYHTASTPLSVLSLDPLGGLR